MTALPHRILTLGELEDFGVSSTGAQRLTQANRLHRVARGVYAPLPWWSELQERERALQVHRAVDRSALVPPVFFRDSAALLHDWRLLRLPVAPQVVSPPHRGTRSTDRLASHHSGAVPDDDVTVRHGLRVTTAERTALDCARFLPMSAAVVVADQALAGGASRDRMSARLARLPGHRGVRRARSVLELADPLSESPGESLTRVVLLRSSLPPFVAQLPVATAHGVFRADFAWPEAHLVLEFDGRVKYFGQMPTAEVLFQERRREKELTNAGWRVLRTDWQTVTQRPEQLVAQLHWELRRHNGRS